MVKFTNKASIARELNALSILEFELSDTEEEQPIDGDIPDNQEIEEYLEGIAYKSALQAVSNVSGGVAATKLKWLGWVRVYQVALHKHRGVFRQSCVLFCEINAIT